MKREPLRKPANARRLRYPDAAMVKLRRELAEARAQLAKQSLEGADERLACRIADLEEGQMIARGKAVEATLARSHAEAELSALKDAIAKAPGLRGWLLRWAARG